ncbi:hypothetical protein [uncultured Thiohalocapsa sp.]|jgi:hypothetical protein|uniref:hypothetical protein n=1 Tax=uncultured Thiohalocapsa sp. TaxID=768990 RepID=UPI0025EC71AB|nr:hypothetical protein [uncultured Thiohalocapsa sp.]
MPRTSKVPSLLAISMAWSAMIAFIMTAITFLHQTPGEVATAGGDGLQWGQVGFLFVLWFVAAEATLVIGGALYLGAALLLGRRSGGG